MFLTAVHERERDQKSPSNVLDERFGRDIPGLPTSDAQAKRTAVERSAEIPPERVPEEDRASKGSRNTTAQSEKSKGECR